MTEIRVPCDRVYVHRSRLLGLPCILLPCTTTPRPVALPSACHANDAGLPFHRVQARLRENQEPRHRQPRPLRRVLHRAMSGQYAATPMETGTPTRASSQRLQASTPSSWAGTARRRRRTRSAACAGVPVRALRRVGYVHFAKRRDLERSYVHGGRVTIMCGVVFLRDGGGGGGGGGLAVPPSDIGRHLGDLLDRAADDGGGATSDVSFSVGGETFRAHRAVLAARPLAGLQGAALRRHGASMSCITLHGIEPSTFAFMLRFMYTDAMPTEEEEAESSSPAATEQLQSLLAAADMYQLDRLKLLCAQKLWVRVSVENVASILGCAETHNCPELKKRCLDFLVEKRNFMKAVLTDGYFRLMDFPSIASSWNSFSEPYKLLFHEIVLGVLETAESNDVKKLVG
ncbi:hypothetical protein ACP4OV_005574 [Aristida adscensionis]